MVQVFVLTSQMMKTLSLNNMNDYIIPDQIRILFTQYSASKSPYTSGRSAICLFPSAYLCLPCSFIFKKSFFAETDFGRVSLIKT